MATTLTPNLKLRVDSNLTANSKYNLNKIDLLGSTFLVDSTNTLNLRSITNIVIEPNSADIGGTGTGGTVSIGTTNHPVELVLNGGLALKDLAATSTGKLNLQYNSTLNDTIKDDTARTLTIDVNGANRSLVLGGDLTYIGPSKLTLALHSPTEAARLVIRPTTGPLGEYVVTETSVATLTNKSINADNNTIRNIDNEAIKVGAQIAYSKLQLAASIKNGDISSSFIDRIEYYKLDLANKIRGTDIDAAYPISYGSLTLLNSIKNSDISSTAAIAYSKLALANAIQNSDISSTAAISYSKLNLAAQIVNADISPTASIARSKLNLTNSITNADISSSAAIAYTKLNLSNSITNSDISPTAAVAYSKLDLAGQLTNVDISSTAEIAYTKLDLENTIVNSDIASNAAIAGTKISPQFGNQNIRTSSTVEWDNGTHITALAQASAGQTESFTLRLPSGKGTAGAILSTDGAGNLSWATTGAGSVTSVDLSAPVEFIVSGNPITGAGTLTLAKANQESNQIYAGPAAGAAAQPSFRSLVSDDIPTLTPTKVGLGNVPNIDATSPNNINQDANHRFVTDAEKATWDGKQDALGFTPENAAHKGIADGYAPLNAFTKLDNSYLSTDFTDPANIVQSSSYRFVTDAEKATWDGKQDALGYIPEDTASKGQPNGYAPLNASGKLDNSYLNATVLNYHGTWDAATNTPPLSDGMIGASAGDVYIVSTGGTVTFGPGNTITFASGDWALYNQSNMWEKIVNSNSVTSVNGATGSVTVNAINELTGDVVAGPASGSESVVATIADNAITNIKISSTAQIDVSKLAAGGPGQILQTSNGIPTWSNLNYPVTSVNNETGVIVIDALNELTGDVIAGPATGSESKAATIAAGAITDSKVSATAGIAVSKLASGVDNQILQTIAGTPTWTSFVGTVESVNGDTGAVTVNAINQLTGDVTTTIASGSEPVTATISNGAITDSKISATANIAVSKLSTGIDGQVLQVVSGVPTWSAAAASGVSSVGLSLPDEFNVSNSPIVSSGTIQVTKVAQAANLVYSGPSSGGSAQPTFRSLVSADIPTLSPSKVGLENVPNVDATNPANITQSASYRFVTDTEKATWNSKQASIGTGTTDQFLRGDLTWQTVSGGGTTITDPSELSMDAATRLGYKEYIAGNNYKDGTTVQILTNSPQVQYSNLQGTLIPYKTNSGSWRLKGNTQAGEYTDFYYTLQNNNSQNIPFNGNILSMIRQGQTGKVWVAGEFTLLNGLIRNRLIRFNTDANGTEDTAFYSNLGQGFNNKINVLVGTSDGKVFVGGAFTSFYDTSVGARQRFLRLNSDGSEDSTFNANLGTGFDNGEVKCIAVRFDGKILVGGSFTSFKGNTRNRLVCLNSDGTEDTTFYNNMTNSVPSNGLNGDVNAIGVFGGNFCIVGGTFTSYTGSGGTVTRNRLMSFSNTGTENTSFYTNLGTAITNGQVNTIFVGDQIYVGGSFTTFNGNTRNRVIKVSTGGVENSSWYSFTNGFNDTVNVIAEGPSGYLFGGKFTQSGVAQNRGLVEFLFNGSSTTFNSNLGQGFVGGEVFAVANQASNNYWFIGGSFTNFNNQPKRNLIRILSSGIEETIPRSVIYTLPGVTFNTSTSWPYTQGIDLGASVSDAGQVSVSGPNTITAQYYPKSVHLTFDLPLAGPPTWAYVDPPPQITAAVYNNFSPTNGEVEVTWTGIALTWETQYFDGTTWIPDSSGSIGSPSPQVLASFVRPPYSQGDSLYRIRVSNDSGSSSWSQFTVEKEAFSSIVITGLNVTYPTNTTANISTDYTIIAPATATYYSVHRFEGGSWTTVIDGSPSASPIEVLNVDRPSPGTSTLYKITISANDGTSDEQEFTIDEALLLPIIGFANVDPQYDAYNALLNVTYENGATQYELQYYDDMSLTWLTYGFPQGIYPPSGPTGPLYVYINRYGSGPTQWRILVGNSAGWSQPSNSVYILRNTNPNPAPQVWNVNTTPMGSTFTAQISYTGTPSPNNYEIQIYSGDPSLGYSDINPNNWYAATGGMLMGNPTTTGAIASPAQTTVGRARVSGFMGGDSISTWFNFGVPGAS